MGSKRLGRRGWGQVGRGECSCFRQSRCAVLQVSNWPTLCVRLNDLRSPFQHLPSLAIELVSCSVLDWRRRVRQGKTDRTKPWQLAVGAVALKSNSTPV